MRKVFDELVSKPCSVPPNIDELVIERLLALWLDCPCYCDGLGAEIDGFVDVGLSVLDLGQGAWRKGQEGEADEGMHSDDLFAKRVLVRYQGGG